MPHELTFVNHACFIVESDSALLLVDPWLEGPAFHNGWTLLDRSTSSAQVIGRLNKSGLPVFVWLSSERQDHFSPLFIKRFREQFRGMATFLYRHTLDKRVAGFLRKQGLDVAECREGQPVALGRDMRLTAFPFGDGQSWCVIHCGRRAILNLAGCAPATHEQCRAIRARLDQVAPRVDLMLTQFGYAGWVGNPDQPSLHKAAAHDRLNRIALQASHVRPRLLVPFASFMLFAHPDNAYLNEAQNTPLAVARAPQLARHAHLVRFLRPGSKVDLDTDSAASLTLEHERAMAHWMALLARPRPLLPALPGVSMQELKSAFARYRATAAQALHGLPALLEAVHAIRPLALRLADLGETVQVSYRHGLRTLERGARWDVALGSADALHLFKSEHGYDTLHAGARLRLGAPQAAHALRRFCLPQRMAANGYGRRHPLVTVRYLLGYLAARAGRQIQAVLRLSA